MPAKKSGSRVTRKRPSRGVKSVRFARLAERKSATTRRKTSRKR